MRAAGQAPAASSLLRLPSIRRTPPGAVTGDSNLSANGSGSAWANRTGRPANQLRGRPTGREEIGHNQADQRLTASNASSAKSSRSICSEPLNTPSNRRAPASDSSKTEAMALSGSWYRLGPRTERMKWWRLKGPACILPRAVPSVCAPEHRRQAGTQWSATDAAS